MKSKLIIIGASGHGKVVADIALLNGYKEILFLDDNPNVKECAGFVVGGSSKEVDKYRDSSDVFIAIGNPRTRKMLQERMKNAGYTIATLIHPRAVVGIMTSVGEGTVVMANAVINPCTTIGEGCIINTGCTVDHDNKISDYVHVSVGAHLAGTVHVGERTWIGAGATVSNNINICADCMIGAGAVVVNDIEESGTYIGVPARKK